MKKDMWPLVDDERTRVRVPWCGHRPPELSLDYRRCMDQRWAFAVAELGDAMEAADHAGQEGPQAKTDPRSL